MKKKREYRDPQSPSDIYRKRSLASRLCIGIRTLEKMVTEKRMPAPFYLGTSPCWRKVDIDAWLEKLASEAQTKKKDSDGDASE